MEKKEVWMPIEGYEGHYEISSLGRVKGCKRTMVNKSGRTHTVAGRIMKPHYLPNGYLAIGLSKNNKKTDFYIHRLVAFAFIPNKGNLPEINHKDENKQNNVVDNLEWCTSSQNKRHGTYITRMSATKRRQGGKRVKQYTTDGAFVRQYVSVRQASRCVGVSMTAIKDAIIGKQKKSAGYVWKWADG